MKNLNDQLKINSFRRVGDGEQSVVFRENLDIQQRVERARAALAGTPYRPITPAKQAKKKKGKKN